ncbi:MAG: threonine-phosphate decarboxylase [Deltaproteobacteria bacterium]|nr:threonine-phosphate decarboxylase [Deltaproteobacteria bacterium]
MKDIHGGDIWRASAESGFELTSLMDFSASINPLGLSPKARAAIKEALRLAPPYPEPYAASLRAALASYHSVAPEELIAGNGSTEFIYLLPQVYRSERALIVEPAFSEYGKALRLSGCAVESFMLREDAGFSLDIKRFAGAVKKGYGLVYIGNPSNPTGSVVEKETVLEAAGILERYGSTLVVDEAFADFSETRSVKREAVKRKNIVVLRSMTKFFSMAGLRLGFIVANSSIVKRFAGRLPPWSVNTVASFAAAASLKDTRYIERTRRWLASERAFLFKALSAIKGLTVYPSEANFLMVRINCPGVAAPDVREALLKLGILVRDLSAFRGLGPEYMRFAVRKRDENVALTDGLGKFFGRSGY